MLKGLGGLGDMAKMMKAAQDIQTRMAELQDSLGAMNVVGESGAGLVTATCTAKGELKALDIDRDACRAFAERMTWENCARTFVHHVGAAASQTQPLGHGLEQ